MFHEPVPAIARKAGQWPRCARAGAFLLAKNRGGFCGGMTAPRARGKLSTLNQKPSTSTPPLLPSPRMQTIVIGHKNPDMDSICAALAYAELKRLQGQEEVVAARAGATNQRIDYVLTKFGWEAPRLITDLS